MKTIWVICTGNTCRSPMGEALLRDQLEKLGRSDEFEVKSGGLQAFQGIGVNPVARKALQEINLDISGHYSHRVTTKELLEADYILVMTTGHKEAILQKLPSLENKIHVLNIDDPFGQSLEVYRQCRDQMVKFFKEIFGE